MDSLDFDPFFGWVEQELDPHGHAAVDTTSQTRKHARCGTDISNDICRTDFDDLGQYSLENWHGDLIEQLTEDVPCSSALSGIGLSPTDRPDQCANDVVPHTQRCNFNTGCKDGIDPSTMIDQNADDLKYWEELAPDRPSKDPKPSEVMKRWASQNPTVLYPSAAIKASLSHLSRLSFRQVSTWFSNYRQRKIKPLFVPPKQIGVHSDHAPQPPASRLRNRSELNRIKSLSMISGGQISSNKLSSHDVAAPSSPRASLSPSWIDNDVSEHVQHLRTLSMASGFESGLDLLTVWMLTLPEDGCYDVMETHLEPSFINEQFQYQDDQTSAVGQRSEYCKEGRSSTAQYMIEKFKINKIFKSLPTIKSKRPSSGSGKSYTRRARRCVSTGPTDMSRRQQSEHDGASDTSDGTTNSSGPQNSSFSQQKLFGMTGAISPLGRSTSPGDTSGWRQSGHDVASAKSNSTTNSILSQRSSASRRGRRIQGAAFVANKPYHCSRCRQGFSRAADQRRHEKSVHEKAVGWVCSPIVGGKSMFWKRIQFDTVLAFHCFCESDAAECGHEMWPCWNKPMAERTFYRADHFKKHLILTHKLDLETAKRVMPVLKEGSNELYHSKNPDSVLGWLS